MKKRVRISAAAGAAVLCAAALYWLPLTAARNGAGEAYPYTLREYNGCVAVYRGGGSEPERVTDIEVRLLPEYDRLQLRAGVPVEDSRMLAMLLEDLGA